MRIISLYEGLQEIAQYEIESWADGHIVTLGRSESTQWSFPSQMELSRHHLSIRKLGNELYLRDEQSSNGTFADGVALTHPIRMRADVSYQVGNLSFYLEGAAASEATEHIDCSTVFPEAIAFAAEFPAETPAGEAPIYSLEPEPVVEQTPIYSLEPEPVVEQTPIYSLEPEPVVDSAAIPALASPTAQAVKLASGRVKPFLPIAGVPKSGVGRDFELHVRLLNDRPEVRIGEQLIFQVFSSEPCQLLLLCREESGATSMLYPNKQQISQNIPANQWTQIPNPSNPHFEFIIEGPEGRDEIQAIARRIGDSRMRKNSAKKSSDPTKATPKEEGKWSHASLYVDIYES